eukprot:TRINITY_DN12090_c0_g1_i2.p1 TRINITY_DN12090_c0_g1~~TRINITY_DN12090_c0_g1_i2.p1  ORF type:complete len:233 (-),score=35.72 TRINITY_DN12090_c0_g1_i2:312-1010(-)
MKITALLVLKGNPSPNSDVEPLILTSATDLGQFGYFQRTSAKEFIMFVGRTIAKRTPPGQRQSVQQDEYKVHCYNKNGLCVVAFMDHHYPVRSAFSLINKSIVAFGEKYYYACPCAHVYGFWIIADIRLLIIEEYVKTFGESWRTVQSDSSQSWPYLNEALTKFQDPAEADKLLKIQKDLDETKIILHKTIDSVLARGEKLDSLVEKSTDLSMASQMFYKQAKKTNQCCTLL